VGAPLSSPSIAFAAAVAELSPRSTKSAPNGRQREAMATSSSMVQPRLYKKKEKAQ
jgi:hypothetical protein